jgi:hypothetical protein
MTWQWVVVILGTIGLILAFLAFGIIATRGGKVAEPKLQIEQRLDRLELAVGTMAQWLVQAQTGFGAHDAEGIEKILRGEKVEESKEDDPTIHR